MFNYLVEIVLHPVFPFHLRGVPSLLKIQWKGAEVLWGYKEAIQV